MIAPPSSCARPLSVIARVASTTFSHLLRSYLAREHWKVKQCIEKYEGRGFTVCGFQISGANHGRSGNEPSWYCPHARRFFGDRGCLVFPFAGGGEKNCNGTGGFHPLLAPRFRLGGMSVEVAVLSPLHARSYSEVYHCCNPPG